MPLEIFTYSIDKEDKIVFVDDAFLKFAKENNTPELSRGALYGSSLWDYVAGNDTLFYQKLIVRSVRRHRQSINYNFNCDGPDKLRKMVMHIEAAKDGSIVFRSELLEETESSYNPLLARKSNQNSQVSQICSYCKKIKTLSGAWLEAGKVLQKLESIDEPLGPDISHGICDDCRKDVFDTYLSYKASFSR